MASLPPDVLNALRDSKHYFIATSGELIPLLSISKIRVVGPQELPRDMSATESGRRLAARMASIEEGSLAISILGSTQLPNVGDIIVGPNEKPSFLAALRNLGA